MRGLIVLFLLIACSAQAVELKPALRARSQTFQNVSTLGGVSVPQKTTEGYVTMWEGSSYSGAGTNAVRIAPIQGRISSNINITIGNHGLYKNGVRVITW